MLSSIIHHIRVFFNARKTWLERTPQSDLLPEPEWKVTACATSSLFGAGGGGGGGRLMTFCQN